MLSYLASRIDTFIPYLNRKKLLEGPASCSMAGIQFMELDNCWIRYLIRGNGARTIVIAPDSPVTMEAYSELVDELAKKYRVVLFETPAFSFSVPKPHFNFSFEALTETITEFLKRINLGPYVLAIPCVAGLSGIAIANKYPEMVEAIVSTQTPNWQQQRTWVRSWDNVGFIGVMTWPFWAQILGFYFKKDKLHLCHKRITHQRREELMALSKKTLGQGACNPLPSACQCYLLKREPGWLGQAKQPSISIWGKKDKSHIITKTDRMTILDYLPHAKLIDFDDAGHFLEAEVPLKFARVVSEFVDQLPPRV